MNELRDLPAERDLAPERQARMRADVVAAMSRRRGRSVRPRLAVLAAAAVTVVGGVLLALPGDGDGERLLAMGPDELSPTLQRATEQCLAWKAPHEPGSVSLSDLAVAAQRDHQAAVLFLTGAGYLACHVSVVPGEEPTGVVDGAERWPHGDLLPGPVDRLSVSSSERDGGEVAVSGRVSARVHRLVLEHGDGHTTTARLANGVFGLLSAGSDVQEDAELVSYDAAGREIDRRPLFQPTDRLDRCYTDPSGAVIYGRPGPDCQPAERWNRR